MRKWLKKHVEVDWNWWGLGFSFYFYEGFGGVAVQIGPFLIS